MRLTKLFQLVSLVLLLSGFVAAQSQAPPTGYVQPYAMAGMGPNGAFAYFGANSSGALITAPTAGTLLQISGFVQPYAPVAQDSNGIWHYLQVNSSGALVTTGGGGGGSGTVNAGTTNQLAVYPGNGTTVQGDATLTDTGSLVTISGVTGLTISGTNAVLLLSGGGTANIQDVEGTAPAGVVGSDLLFSIAAIHRWEMLNNNGTALVLPGISTAGITANTIPLISSSTYDLAASLLTDNGTTLNYGGTGGITGAKIGATGSGAGQLFCTQGAAPGAPTNGVGFICPVTVATGFNFTLTNALPGAASSLLISTTGVWSYATLSNPATTQLQTSTGTLTSTALVKFNASGDAIASLATESGTALSYAGSGGIVSGANGGSGGLITFNGATSGNSTISVTATGGTLTLPSGTAANPSQNYAANAANTGWFAGSANAACWSNVGTPKSCFNNLGNEVGNTSGYAFSQSNTAAGTSGPNISVTGTGTTEWIDISTPLVDLAKCQFTATAIATSPGTALCILTLPNSATALRIDCFIDYIESSTTTFALDYQFAQTPTNVNFTAQIYTSNASPAASSIGTVTTANTSANTILTGGTPGATGTFKSNIFGTFTSNAATGNLTIHGIAGAGSAITATGGCWAH